MGKSTRILVAVTQRVDPIGGRNEVRDSLDQRVAKWLLDAGFYPIPVPNSMVEVDGSDGLDEGRLPDWISLVKPAAIILSGGNDIGEFPERDLTERLLLSWAQEHRIPVLGVCRGMQLMAVWAGADLTNVPGHVGTRHVLAISDGSIANWPKSVNSFHNWAITDCPAHFRVTARAEDGVIEAFAHMTLPWEGWMWHPEREEKFATEDTERIKRLILGKEELK